MYPNQDYKINVPEGGEAAPQRKPLKQRRKSRLPLLVVVAIAAAGGYWYFTQGGEEDINIGNSVVPLIKADTSPEKEKPENPGGMDIPHQDKMVFDEMNANTNSQSQNQSLQVENLLPPTAAPQELPTDGQTTEGSGVKEIVVSPPQSSQGATENLTASAEPAAPPPTPTVPVEAAPVVAPSVPAPVPAPAPMVEAAPAPEASPAATEPAPEPAPAAAESAVKLDTFTAEPGGKYWLQLISLKSVEAAQTAAKNYAKKHPNVLSQLDINVDKVDLGAKGVFYRLQFGPFKEKTTAEKACAALKAQKQDCFIATN